MPHPGSFSQLFGVSCASPRSCWAVGTYLNGNRADVNQALHWNGTKWSLAATPDPGGTGAGASSTLSGVACATSANCWAVGRYVSGNRADLNQALHWNGARWSSVSVPSPGGTALHDSSELAGVRCTSSANCWAVGDYINANGNGASLDQALHWNGRTWSQASTPNPGGTGAFAFSALNGLTCATSADCWAVGRYVSGNRANLNQALHWNGRTWSLVAIPDQAGTAAGAFSTLRGVACATSADCWAAGSAFTSAGALVNQALHWNGRTWSLAATPDPDGTGAGGNNFLRAVACAAPANCWAVGQYGFIGNGSGVVVNQALHWNGRKWSLVATPDPAGTANGDANGLWSVRCISPASCWAVGFSVNTGGVEQNQAMRWNGTRWSTR